MISKEEYYKALRDIQSNDPVVKENARLLLVAWHKQFKDKVESKFGNLMEDNQTINKESYLVKLIKKKREE